MKTTCSEPHSPIFRVISLHLAAKLWVISSISLHPYYIPASHLSNIPRSFPIPQVKILWNILSFLNPSLPCPCTSLVSFESSSFFSDPVLTRLTANSSAHPALLLPCLDYSNHLTGTCGWLSICGSRPYSSFRTRAEWAAVPGPQAAQCGTVNGEGCKCTGMYCTAVLGGSIYRKGGKCATT